MQDGYAGDVGDFGKIALLRHLSRGFRLGVCWYKTQGDGMNRNDGKFISYLERPDFKLLELDVFEGLKQVVKSRSIAALEASGLLGRAKFHDAPVPKNPERTAWAKALVHEMRDRDFVFLDPDNGLQGSRLTPKHVSFSEIKELRQKGRVLVVYHHQGRRKACEQAKWLKEKLLEQYGGTVRVELVRFRPYASRFYTIAGHKREVSSRIEEFVNTWGPTRIEHFRPDA